MYIIKTKPLQMQGFRYGVLNYQPNNCFNAMIYSGKRSSPTFNNSTTAWALPLTPSFCMTLLIWLRTVFSLINSCFAISFVVLSCTSSSNTSLSRLVSNGLDFCSFPFKKPPLLATGSITRLRIQSSYCMTGHGWRCGLLRDWACAHSIFRQFLFGDDFTDLQAERQKSSILDFFHFIYTNQVDDGI